MSLKNIRKTNYVYSLILMFLFAMVLAPATAYAHEGDVVIVTSSPTDSITVQPVTVQPATIQPLTGASIAQESLPSSLIEELYTYLVDSFTVGLIDENKYNEILNSGYISENAFFSHSVFVGDSLTVGFDQYCSSHSDSVKTDTTYFLARVSCSAKVAISSNALSKHSGIMPIYNGNVTYIEDAVAQMSDVNKVFICFGVNDLVGSTPEQFISSMQTLISRILEKRPDVSIYVMSVPCVMSDVNKGNLNNYNIQLSNILLQDMCRTSGWGFINLTEYIMCPDTSLRPDFCSDGYVHENGSAYSVWNKVLKNYAFSEIVK